MAPIAWLRRVATVSIAAPTAIAALKSWWGAALLLHGLHAYALVEYTEIARRYQEAVLAPAHPSTRACSWLFCACTLLVGCSAHAGIHAVGEDKTLASFATASRCACRSMMQTCAVAGSGPITAAQTPYQNMLLCSFPCDPQASQPRRPWSCWGRRTSRSCCRKSLLEVVWGTESLHRRRSAGLTDPDAQLHAVVGARKITLRTGRLRRTSRRRPRLAPRRMLRCRRASFRRRCHVP